MTKNRAKEIINNLIDYLAAAMDTQEQIEALINIGFTKKELKEFHYSEVDIEAYYSES